MAQKRDAKTVELSGYFRNLRLDRDVDADSKHASLTSHDPLHGRTPGGSITDDYFQQLATQAGTIPNVTLVPRPPMGGSPSRPFSAREAGASAGAQPSSPSGYNSPSSSTTKSPHFLLPPARAEHRNRNVLVLDLDETLVHSSSSRRSHDPTSKSDLILPLELDGKHCEVFVKLRPYVLEFLAAVGDMFEVVIFTASLSKYASPLIDRLDPDGQHCHHRLYREHCTYYEGSHVKDLTLLGRPINKMIIIDNSPAAYLYQPRNAIPCTTWFDDKSDTELQQFLPFLKLLSVAEDVYPILDAYHELLQQQCV